MKPHATFYMLVDISQTGMGSVEFCYALLRGAHVAVVPGITYGKCCDRFVRIAFTRELDYIREGIARIATFVNRL